MERSHRGLSNGAFTIIVRAADQELRRKMVNLSGVKDYVTR